MRQAYSVAEDAETLSGIRNYMGQDWAHGTAMQRQQSPLHDTLHMHSAKKLPKLLHLQNLLNSSFFLLVLLDRECFANFLDMKPS